jgi:hypothetical protein
MTTMEIKRREGLSAASGKSDNTHESEIGKSGICVGLGSRKRREEEEVSMKNAKCIDSTNSGEWVE